MRYKFKGHIIEVSAIYESAKSRVARGDWRSRILGYRYEVRRPAETKILAEGEGFDTQDQADDEARERIQAWEDSL